ncbi:MAG: hypothetical protein IBX70_06025 [Clostridia bacterium]|nr:hypothetical protein [Clostridia bacterium]
MQHLNVASDRVSKLVDEGLLEIDSLTKIASASEGLAELAQNLQNIIKKFKI